MENGTVRADRHRIRGIPDGAAVNLDELPVHPQTAGLHEIPVRTGAKLRRLAVVAEHLRAGRVDLEQILDRHRRGLNLIAGVGECWNGADVRARVVAEPPRVE